MKLPILGIILTALSLLVMPINPLALTGCSTSAQRTTINSLFTTGQTVDAAYKGYLDLVVRKQLPTNDVPRISKAYMEFQQAFGAAVTLAAFNTNAPPTPEVVNASSQVLLSIQSAKERK